MATFLGCIADDFTGATDLAGLLARSGLPVSLRIGVPAAPDVDAAPFEVIALKCRTVPKAEAVAATRAALDWLIAAGAKKFYWKYCSTFDSTPQGNIGPVAEALLEALGASQTLYCPAFPENGRSIYMGHLFVGETRLDESPMKDHPLTPMRDSSLVRLLEPQVTGAVGLARWPDVAGGAEKLRARLEQLAGEGVRHVIVDAIDDKDISMIAEACRHMPLLTGGSALAAPLPALYLRDGLVKPDAGKSKTPSVGRPSIVFSGSCSAMTRAQVAAFSARAASLRLDPLALADGAALAEADAWLRAQPLDVPKLLYATAEPDEVRRAQDALGRERAGAIVEEAFAKLALAAFEIGTRRFVVAGGETAGAVTQALGVEKLMIGPEIAPGVPWTFAHRDETTIALALKSGNFGGRGFFSDALEILG